MSVAEIRLHAAQGRTAGTVANWRVNQVLQATVLRSGSPGTALLDIGGRAYVAGTWITVLPGQQLQLRVTSLSPQVVLAPLTEPTGSVPIPFKPAAVLSPALLESTRATGARSDSKPLNLLILLDSGRGLSLTPENQRQIQQLRGNLMLFNELRNPAVLRTAFANSGIFFESKALARQTATAVSPPEAEADYKGLLFQLFDSLYRHSSAAATRAPSTASGLAAYLQPDPVAARNGEPARLLQSVEDALKGITARQQQSLAESNESKTCWYFDLPVRFRDSVRLIPFTLYREQPSSAANADVTRAGAEFSLELARSGAIRVQLELVGNAVTVALGATHTNTLERLQQDRDRLSHGLGRHGLALKTLRNLPAPQDTH